MANSVFVQKTTSSGEIEYLFRFREASHYAPSFQVGYLTKGLIAGGLPYEDLDPVLAEMRRQHEQLTDDTVEIGQWADPDPRNGPFERDTQHDAEVAIEADA